MIDDIVHESTFPHQPSLVWRALTTREGLEAWLMRNTLEEPVVGHRFRFMDKPKKVLGWDGVVECEVLEVEPERRFVIRFGAEGGKFPVTRVTWDLEPVPEGTRVRLRHEGFTGLKGWMMRQGMDNGWGWGLEHGVRVVLEHLEAGALPERDALEREVKRRVREERAARRQSA